MQMEGRQFEPCDQANVLSPAGTPSENFGLLIGQEQQVVAHVPQ